MTVGDLAGNTDKILDYVEKARRLGADLVAFPELAIPGYPPEDLLFKPQFISDNLAQLSRVVDGSSGIGVVIGFATEGPDVYNAAAFAYDGRLVGVYHKIFLPNYGVFDEQRYFKAGAECPVYVLGDAAVGINVCEDIWYEDGPAAVQRAAGAQLIVNVNGSPYHAGKLDGRERMLSRRASDNGLFLAYVNMVGGQDELVFDGGSMILDPAGEVVARGPQFEEAMIVADISLDKVAPPPARSKRPGPAIWEPRVVAVAASAGAGEDARPPIVQDQPRRYDPVGEIYAALVMGTRDYVRKSGFSKVLVALSGGIDSSLVVAIAVDALGADNVVAVAMPSRFSSEGSVLDANELADNLGIELKTMPIEGPFSAYMDTLAPHFEGTEWGVARGERPVPHPRQPDHGAVKQAGMDGPGHGEQERDGHRVRHDLRRHGRRVRRHQGCPQDPRLRAVRAPQSAGADAGHSRQRHPEGAQRGASAGPKGRGQPPSLLHP